MWSRYWAKKNQIMIHKWLHLCYKIYNIRTNGMDYRELKFEESFLRKKKNMRMCFRVHMTWCPARLYCVCSSSIPRTTFCCVLDLFFLLYLHMILISHNIFGFVVRWWFFVDVANSTGRSGKREENTKSSQNNTPKYLYIETMTILGFCV